MSVLYMSNFKVKEWKQMKVFLISLLIIQVLFIRKNLVINRKDLLSPSDDVIKLTS